jgi:ABC-type Fe3+-siderophore transport system permease subunit
MNDSTEFQALKRFAYRRMLFGAGIGGAITFACGYWLAWSSDSLNPVTGLGLLVLSSIGMVVGALCGLISKQWSHSNPNNSQERTE